MDNIKKAKALLVDDFTCIVVSDNLVLKSKQKGISPMLDWIDENQALQGCAVADRIVGKAASMLFVKAKISYVYGEVMSKGAIAYLEKYHIPYEYQELCDIIINRKKDGMCPMEATVKDIDDYQAGYEAIKKKREELRRMKL